MPGTPKRVSVCVSERSVCPQNIPAFTFRWTSITHFVIKVCLWWQRGERSSALLPLLSWEWPQGSISQPAITRPQNAALPLPFKSCCCPFWCDSWLTKQRCPQIGMFTMPQGYQEQQTQTFLFNTACCFSHLLGFNEGVVHHLEQLAFGYTQTRLWPTGCCYFLQRWHIAISHRLYQKFSIFWSGRWTHKHTIRPTDVL